MEIGASVFKERHIKRICLWWKPQCFVTQRTEPEQVSNCLITLSLVNFLSGCPQHQIFMGEIWFGYILFWEEIQIYWQGGWRKTFTIELISPSNLSYSSHTTESFRPAQ